MLLSKALKARISELMKEKHIKSQHELSLKAGVSYTTINDFFRNRTSTLGINKIVHICEAFNMDLSEFFKSPLFKNIECDDDK